jgi:hypothetical protein
MVLEDRSLLRMTEEQFLAALSAKAATTVAMGQVFAECTRDFILFFSSLQSFAKSAGQGNYAAGSLFADVYAAALARRCQCKVRVINWGYWSEVGAVRDEKHRARMIRRGIHSIDPATAMDDVRKILALPLEQAAVLRGTAAELAALGVSDAEALKVLV